MARTLTHFSLCSGIGGLDLAAEWAGFETVGQCEIDEYASRVLAKNFPGVKNYGDIRTITNERITADGIKRGEITVLSAGIPCQPYSLAGKGLGDSDERDLEQELIRVIGELAPQWVVVENTPGLFARANQRYFNRILTDISALGYSVGWGMWGACDVGAPHKRDRVFIIAHTVCERRRIMVKIKKNVFATEFNSILRCNEEKTTLQKISLLHGLCWNVSITNSELIRNDNGLPEALDEIKCYGNAVVPQQAYPIFKAIADYEITNGGRKMKAVMIKTIKDEARKETAREILKKETIRLERMLEKASNWDKHMHTNGGKERITAEAQENLIVGLLDALKEIAAEYGVEVKK